jgi:hypothetical protein
MPSEFRPTTPSDGPLLVSMAQRLLGVEQGSPMFAAPHLHWKYWAAWRSASLARSHVLVRDGQIVAHAGVLPLECRARGRVFTLLHPFDWMSEPAAIGSGAALLQRLAKLADGLVIVGGSAMTQRMVGPLGFRAVGEVTRYVASAARSATPDGTSSEAFHSREDDAGVAITRTDPSAAPDCESVEPPETWLSFALTPERLQDHQGCPAAPMAVYTAVRSGSPGGEKDARLGGFVLAFAPEQARIVALWTASSNSEDRALLARLAYQQARKQPGVREVVTMANAPLEQRALVACGFQPAGSVPMFVLARELDVELRLSFQMLDGDVAFLHRGAPDPWL